MGMALWEWAEAEIEKDEWGGRNNTAKRIGVNADSVRSAISVRRKKAGDQASGVGHLASGEATAEGVAGGGVGTPGMNAGAGGPSAERPLDAEAGGEGDGKGNGGRALESPPTEEAAPALKEEAAAALKLLARSLALDFLCASGQDEAFGRWLLRGGVG